MRQITIAAADAGQRFDRWAKAHLPHVPFVQLQKHLRKGAIRLDGKRVKPDTRIEGGQVVALRPEVEHGTRPASAPKARPEVGAYQARDLERMVIHRDALCLVLNKPAGLAVQGGSGVKDSVDNRLAALAEAGEVPKLVHRIDRDTSGILVLARDRRAAARLTRAFAKKEIEKVYWALAVGVPEAREGTIDLPIEKQGAREKMAVTETGQRAITEYRVLEKFGRALSLIELRPVTGRTHQLRVHLAALGHPIYGDGKYGGKAAFEGAPGLPAQLHLHARRIVLEEGDYRLDVTAPLPRHMRESFDLLGIALA